MHQELSRRAKSLLWVTCLAAACLGVQPSDWRCTARASTRRRTEVVEAVEKARSAVVNIQGRKTIRGDAAEGAAGEPFRQVNGMGTGVIIDLRGYILTNLHVVENVEVIQVTLADKRSYVAQLVSHDLLTDLAVIRIEAEAPLSVIDAGISSDLMPGEPVIAVGNAFGYEHTVTRGIISALHREVQVSASQRYHDLIQTDASINPGNSGGPLLNADGQMIGINVAVRVGAQGIGFAIPVDEALEIAAELMSSERLERRRHGIAGETRFEGNQRRFVVTRVGQSSAAESCGLQVGDVITTVDQLPIQRAIDFQKALLGRASAAAVVLTVERDTEVLSLQMPWEPAVAVADDFDQRTWSELGVKLTQATGVECQRYHANYRGGMRVLAVRGDGPAARQGIRAGDILVGMHVWETISRENVRYILDRQGADQQQPLKFYVLRDGETLYGHLNFNDPGNPLISALPNRE